MIAVILSLVKGFLETVVGIHYGVPFYKKLGLQLLEKVSDEGPSPIKLLVFAKM